MKKLIRTFIFTLCAVAFCAGGTYNAAFAQDGKSTYSVQSVGEGDTLSNATAKALQEAIKQTQGASLSVNERQMLDATEKSSIKNGAENSSSTMEDRFLKYVETTAKGRFSKYDRVSETKDPKTGNWTVTLRVYFYKIPGANSNRHKIAVLPFRYHDGKYKLDNSTLNPGGIAQRLSQRITASFVKSQKFIVLDRDYQSELKSETDFIKSGEVQANELAKLGQALGADYLIVGSIEEFVGSRDRRTLRTTGAEVDIFNGTVIVSYRLFSVVSRKIEWTDTPRLDLSKVPGNLLENRFDTAITWTAHYISQGTLDNVYPIKIVGEPDARGELVIGRGGNQVRVGSYYTVMGLSARLIDPDSGDDLGARETEVATIQITRVDPKVSYARVFRGTASSIKKGDIVRPYRAPVPAAR